MQGPFQAVGTVNALRGRKSRAGVGSLESRVAIARIWLALVHTLVLAQNWPVEASPISPFGLGNVLLVVC